MQVYSIPTVVSPYSLICQLGISVFAQSGGATTNQCSELVQQGGDTPETHTIQMGATSGTFNFTYNTFSIDDQVVVSDDTGVIFDSGCIGTVNPVVEALTFSSSSSSVTVEVSPNCPSGTGTGTQWEFTVACPT